MLCWKYLIACIYISPTEQLEKTKTASALKAVFIIYQLKNTVIFQPAEPQ